MVQTDIKICILLFYIFLRNVMAFDKELVILYGFSNLRISEEIFLPFQIKAAMGSKTFFFLNFCLISYQNAYNFVRNCQILCFKSIQNYTFGPPPTNVPLKIRKFGHILPFLMTSTPSHVTQRDQVWLVRKLLMIFQVWAKFISFGFQILTKRGRVVFSSPPPTSCI